MAKGLVRKKLDADKAMVEILARVSDGESLVAICRDAHLPAKGTFYRWLAEAGDGSEMRDNYARAMEHRGQLFGERVTDIAEQVISDPDLCPQRARVAVDALKWAAGRLAPKTYGDRASVELSGDVTATLVPIIPK